MRWQTNISREDKAAMLGALTLFSVPAIYPEAFGLYVVEAMASGVPVVQPAAASFPEIVARAGVLVPGRRSAPSAPGYDPDPCDGHRPPLAWTARSPQAWHELLQQPEELRAMAERSRRAAEEFYEVGVMRDRFLALARKCSIRRRTIASPRI